MAVAQLNPKFQFRTILVLFLSIVGGSPQFHSPYSMYLDDVDDPLENLLPQRHQGSVPHARRVQQAGGDVQLLGFLQPKGMPGLKWTNFEERHPTFFERQTCGNLMMLDLVAKLYDGNKGTHHILLEDDNDLYG